MSPKKKKQKKRRNRMLAFEDSNWRNERNGTSNPAVVSLEKSTTTRKRRHLLDDTVDVTVDRILGSNSAGFVCQPVLQNVLLPILPSPSVNEEPVPEEPVLEVPIVHDSQSNESTLNHVTNLQEEDHLSPTPSVTPTTDKDPTFNKPIKKDKSHVILPWAGITEFISSNFKCKECDSSIPIEAISKVQVGMATSINFFCENKDCRHIAQLPAETRKGFVDQRPNKTEKKYATAHRNSDYAVNLKMVLAMQQLGCGQAGVAVVGGGVISGSKCIQWKVDSYGGRNRKNTDGTG